MRIGYTVTPALEDATVDPMSARATRDAAALLESLGHNVQEITPPWVGRNLLPDFVRAFAPGVSFTVWLGGQMSGREPTAEDVEPLTWSLWKRASSQDTINYLTAQYRLETAARSIVQDLAEFDVVLTPVLAQRPVPVGEMNGLGSDPMVNFRKSGYFTPFTAVFNVTGQPAISLPLYQGDDGLPTGVQLVGRPAREEVLLGLARQLELALPWADRAAESVAPADIRPSIARARCL